MHGIHLLLLDVWRAACRHIELTESLVDIAGHLARHAPLGALTVVRLTRDRREGELVAAVLTGSVPVVHVERRRLDETDTVVVDRLSAQGALVPLRRGELEWATGLPGAPGASDGPRIAGLLCPGGESGGILLLAPRPGEAFDDRHVGIAAALREPLSVALANDSRLREMRALQEAAEADRESLLARLGRRELGDTVIGGESGLRLVLERVSLVAKSDLPVLILGETGAGKELVARLIHQQSARAGGPVLRVNCGAVPPELIDSELFGHERGSFTSAVKSRKGWFERADGGTLFLDEIGDLPPAVQVRLLRVLQDGWFERVGGHQPIRCDVRVVAATHRDLAAMVSEGRFREDLWYRIAVFPIRIPPLRERPEDIPALARHFAERAAIRFGLPVLEPEPGDLERLMAYHWPGNVRELGSVMDRSAILGNGKTLEIAKALGVMAPAGSPVAGINGSAAHENAAITESAGVAEDARIAGQSGPAGNVLMAGATPEPAALVSLDDAIRSHLLKALALTRGRIEGRHGAAALLRINPHTLRARMRKLGIDWTRYRER